MLTSPTFIISPLAGVRAALAAGGVNGVISIRDPDGDTRADAAIGRVDVPILRMHFHDVEDVKLWEVTLHRISGPRASDVRTALEFIACLPEGKILVHCEAGVSRSPSLAFGLSAILSARQQPMTAETAKELARITKEAAVVWEPNHKIIRLCEIYTPGSDGVLRDAATSATKDYLQADTIFSW